MSQGNCKVFVAVMALVSGLRAEVLQTGELLLAGEPDRFAGFRSQILRLFGRTRGAEKKLRDLFQVEQSQNGQAGNSEFCGKGDAS